MSNDCFQDRRRKLMKTAPVLQARLLHKKRVSLFFAKKKSETFYQHGAKTYLKLHYNSNTGSPRLERFHLVRSPV